MVKIQCQIQEPKILSYIYYYYCPNIEELDSLDKSEYFAYPTHFPFNTENEVQNFLYDMFFSFMKNVKSFRLNSLKICVYVIASLGLK